MEKATITTTPGAQTNGLLFFGEIYGFPCQANTISQIFLSNCQKHGSDEPHYGLSHPFFADTSTPTTISRSKIPSEMEVAPRYNCLHCWHCWHWWHYLHCLHYKHCLHCWHDLHCSHCLHYTAQCVLCSVYFSAQPNKLRPIVKFKNIILLDIYLSQLVRVRGKYTF